MNLAFLTCDKLPNLNLNDQQLIPKLAAHNIHATSQIWSNTNTDWSQFDYLIFRSTWDYYERAPEFNQWLDTIQNLGIKTLNPIEVIQHNKHKFYLKQLQESGITIIPTIFIEKTTDLNLQNLIPTTWEKAVLKPAFSAGSYQTQLFETKNLEDIQAIYQPIASQKDLLLQKFMPEIQSNGETSFIFFNKKFSHAVNKKPANGDFRIQSQFGGIYTPFLPENNLIEQAQQIVNTFQTPLLYARIDGIIINNHLHLMEIECIEPDLYFEHTNTGIDCFINALLDLI
jgi:glutathione synthase/RimK-type ligase-like ATP-grasp enzyme